MAPSNNLDKPESGVCVACCCPVWHSAACSGETASDNAARRSLLVLSAGTCWPSHRTLSPFYRVDSVVRSDVPSAGLDQVHNIAIRSCRITSCVRVLQLLGSRGAESQSSSPRFLCQPGTHRSLPRSERPDSRSSSTLRAACTLPACTLRRVHQTRGQRKRRLCTDTIATHLIISCRAIGISSFFKRFWSRRLPTEAAICISVPGTQANTSNCSDLKQAIQMQRCHQPEIHVAQLFAHCRTSSALWPDICSPFLQSAVARTTNAHCDTGTSS